MTPEFPGSIPGSPVTFQKGEKANKKISDSLTDKLLKKIAYEQWDGKLPTVSGSDANVMIIDSILNNSNE